MIQRVQNGWAVNYSLYSHKSIPVTGVSHEAIVLHTAPERHQCAQYNRWYPGTKTGKRNEHEAKVKRSWFVVCSSTFLGAVEKGKITRRKRKNNPFKLSELPTVFSKPVYTEASVISSYNHDNGTVLIVRIQQRLSCHAAVVSENECPNKRLKRRVIRGSPPGPSFTRCLLNDWSLPRQLIHVRYFLTLQW